MVTPLIGGIGNWGELGQPATFSSTAHCLPPTAYRLRIAERPATMGYLALTLGAGKSNILGLLNKICWYHGRVLSAESADALGLDGSKCLLFRAISGRIRFAGVKARRALSVWDLGRRTAAIVASSPTLTKPL